MSYGPNRKMSLNSVAERPDPKVAQYSSERAQRELDRVLEKIEKKDPGDSGYDRLMRKAERIQNSIR